MPFFALLLLAGALSSLAQCFLALHYVRSLADVAPEPPSGPLPRVSLIVPALNEERAIARAVRSMLAMDYPDLELVLVNDRSTDATGQIMDELAAHDRRVQVVHVDQLPPGWLGKNHANWLGARQATGRWLLFTDADIVYAPEALRQAVAYAESRYLDHLTMAPALEGHSYWLQAFVGYFLVGFLTYERPYLANNPRSRHGIGIGAFNLIRSEAYQAIGTHAAIALRPDDDMRLGIRVKRKGLRQGLVMAGRQLRVEWYTSLWQAVLGLEKNLFAGLEYSWVRVIGTVMGLLLLQVLPWVLVWFTGGAARWLLLAAIASQCLTYLLANGAWMGARAWLLLPALPFCGLLFAYTVARSAVLAQRRGGVVWRGTLYPLKQLKAFSGLD